MKKKLTALKQFLKQSNNQKGIVHLLGLLILLTVGIFVSVAAFKNGTNFLPFADRLERVTEYTQGYFLSANPYADPMSKEGVRTYHRNMNGEFNLGDQIAVYVKVASDLAESTAFQTTLSYPTDLLEATEIITKSQSPPGERGGGACKSDKECGATEFCDHVACIAMEGVVCPDTGSCTSKEKLTCRDDTTCGAGLYCDFSESGQGGSSTSPGKCKVKRGEFKIGESCQKTFDCQKGLHCIQSKFGQEVGTCQESEPKLGGEFRCYSDTECGAGEICQRIMGSSSCKVGDQSNSACTTDIVLQGTQCVPSKRLNGTEGQSCNKNTDCAAGLNCYRNKTDVPGGLCQKERKAADSPLECESDLDCSPSKKCQQLHNSSCETCNDRQFLGSVCANNSVNERIDEINMRPPSNANQGGKQVCNGLSDTSCGAGSSCYSDCASDDTHQGVVTYSCYKSEAPPICPDDNVLGINDIAIAIGNPKPKPPTPDCKRTGCSGQICSDNDYITTCRWSQENSCYTGAICERQVNGKCGWTQTEVLKQCLTNAHKNNLKEGSVCFSQGSCERGLVCTPNKCNAPQEVCNRYELTATCQKPDPKRCPQIATRACRYEKVMCIKAPCPPREICQTFQSACEVPAGWIIDPQTRTPIPNEKDFFIQSWGQTEILAKEGLVKLSGTIEKSDRRSDDNIGLRTKGEPDRPTMAIVIFKALKTGKGEVRVTEAQLKNSLDPSSYVEKGSAAILVGGMPNQPHDEPAAATTNSPETVGVGRKIMRFIFGGGNDN